MSTPPDRLPIRLVVTDDLERSRTTVFFRVFLAIPHLIFVGLWGVAAFAVTIVVWLALTFQGMAPPTLQRFVATYVRYSVQVSAYVLLAASPYPKFGGSAAYPVDVDVELAPRQSRRSVIPRLFLALPSLILAGALGGGAIGGSLPTFTRSVGQGTSSTAAGLQAIGVAAVAAVLTWFATVVRGRAPRGLRDLIAYCVGYGAQATSYLLLVTDRYPTSDPEHVAPFADLDPHPIRLELSDETRRSRLTVFFRLLLAIPHIVWLVLWALLVWVAVSIAWIVALVIGRVPSPLHRFIAAWVRYATHVTAFLLVVGGPFPGFVGAAGSYPVDIAIDPPQRQRRLVTFFRFFLALPALLLGSALGSALWIVGVLGWFAALFTGTMPEGMRNLGAVCLRYSAQSNAYLFLLTDRYPCSSPAVRERPLDVQLELPLFGLPAVPEIEPV
jgi:hypothetical protein